MTKKNFEKLNEKKKKSGDLPWANSRNLVSGTLRVLDKNSIKDRVLNFIPYTLIDEENYFLSQEKSLEVLQKFGFNFLSNYKKCNSKEDIIEYLNYWELNRKNLPFFTDGVVIKINQISQQKILGNTSHSPRWAFAYKFKPERARSRLLKIAFQVSRTGAINPVAHLEPIKLDGSTISKASLYNADFIQKLDIHEKDYVYIEKGGDIIPKIVSIDLLSRDKNSKPIKFLLECPSCFSLLRKKEGEVISFCTNHDCLEQKKSRLKHFVSKQAMNIVSLGPQTVNLFLKYGLVSDFSDFYSLSIEKIINLESIKEKLAIQIIKSIQASKDRPFANFLYAMGIKHLGITAATTLANYFSSVENLSKASIEELKSVENIGDKLALSIFEFFGSEKNLEMIKKSGFIF